MLAHVLAHVCVYMCLHKQGAVSRREETEVDDACSCFAASRKWEKEASHVTGGNSQPK